MRRKKSTSSSQPTDPEEFGDAALSRKQATEMIRRGDSFRDADLRGSDVSGLVFDGLNLAQAKFAEANLMRCSFKDADLTGASFFGANLRDACLDGANLEEADLDYANLDGVTLLGARIRKALFPTRKVSLVDVRAAVASGGRLRMEPFLPGDEDD
ncbi:MAG: pentapeptide repeat-containing protein [Myxococcales bacterium]|nr:pentapeptide repeat-containing protein [Myxococcales bacterium]